MRPAKRRKNSVRGTSNRQPAGSFFYSGAEYLQLRLPDEVLLQILKYFLEEDLCRVSQVCKRFQTIANDVVLWRPLYRSVFEYDCPLVHSAPGKFDFVPPQESEYENVWKESFRQLRKGVHVVTKNNDEIVEALKQRNMVYYYSIDRALLRKKADESIIFVHAGTHKTSGIVIKKNISIIGASAGNVEENVRVESGGSFTFLKPLCSAYLGHLRITFSPGHSLNRGIEVINSSPTIDYCVFTTFNNICLCAIVCVSGSVAKPTIKHCHVGGLALSTVMYSEGARGIFEDNLVSVARIGFYVHEDAHPIIRNNRIHSSRSGVSFFVNLTKRRVIKDNDVIDNRAPVNPFIGGNRVHRSLKGWRKGIVKQDLLFGELYAAHNDDFMFRCNFEIPEVDIEPFP